MPDNNTRKIGPQRLRKAEIENFKGLRHLTVDFNEHDLFVIGGANGSGKSSTIDALTTALSGSVKAVRPVRQDAESARVQVQLTDIMVDLTIQAGKRSPTIKLYDLVKGKRLKDERATLREMFGDYQFSPQKWLDLAPAKQRDELKRLVLDEDGKPLDTTALDSEYTNAYEARRDAKKAAEAAAATLASHPPVDEAPATPPKSDAILERLNKAKAHNDNITNAKSKHESAVRESAAAEREVDRLRKLLANAEAELKKAERRADDAAAEVDAAGDAIDITPIRAELEQIDKLTDAWHRQQRHIEYREANIAAQKAADDAIALVKAIETRKKKLLAAAKYPVDGLEFTDDGVTINGTPLADCSHSEQLRVAMKVALASRKGAPVIFLDNAEAFDETTLFDVLPGIAKEHGCQFIAATCAKLSRYDLLIENGQASQA